MTHWKQKDAMATSLNNEHCQCMQNVSQKSTVKVSDRHFIILWHLAVIEKRTQRAMVEAAPRY